MKVNPTDLRHVSVFRDASDEDLKLFVEKGILRSIEEGEFFFFQGDPATHLYILITGRAKLLQTNPAWTTGQFADTQRMADVWHYARSREDATYPPQPRRSSKYRPRHRKRFLKEMMQELRPHLNLNLMQLMTGYIMEMQERYRELATERVERKLVNCPSAGCPNWQARQRRGNVVELPFSRQDMAEASGTTIFTVSRVLATGNGVVWWKPAVSEW